MTRQVEAEWDEESRALAEGVAVYDREACPGCHIHPAVVDDLGALTFHDRLCPVCKAQAAYGRVLNDRDDAWEKAHGDAKPQTARPGDGRYTSLRVATPEEVAERETKRRP